MSEGSAKTLHRLTDAQLAAAEPVANVWLSASAGSGKTQVLTARVIRLLLSGARPEEILCLTFTKAAAAEMAQRINERLAGWVQAKGGDLASDLRAIGAAYGPEIQARARELFARVLDAPGGGLQIMTIHSFCQSLLGSFPEEAGIIPGFEPLDDRARAELQRDVMAGLVSDAEAKGDDWIVEGLQQLSLDLGEDGAWSFLTRCASAHAALDELAEHKGAVVQIRRRLDLDFKGPVDDLVTGMCEDSVIDKASMRTVAEMNLAWGKGNADSRGAKRAAVIYDWLALSPDRRCAYFADIHGCWSKADGDPLVQSKGFTPPDDSYARLAGELYNWSNRIVQNKAVAEYADRLTAALLVGKAYASRYVDAKRARGLVDFDDLISKASTLLTQQDMTEWVRYKLDRKIDHVLVDEAQDTNQPQWDIIKALSDDFFAGLGQKGEKARTIFAVGDFKQAIYGFQGTDPQKYQNAGDEFAEKIREADSELQRLTLSQSFRSTAPVLDLVNAVIAIGGPEKLGLNEPIDDHFSKKAHIGSVELFRPVTANGESEEEDDEAEEQWLGPEKRKLAERLANYVKSLVDEAPYLESTKAPLKPGDIMILLRSRTELASLLVARLHALKVPVAGIDRMKIGEQIAVQDLLSAIRFVLQPGDDLSLACLLVSPLIGWSQQQLLDHGYRAKGVSLWQHLRSQTAIADDLAPLRAMLADADYSTPYAFLETILSGPTGGRRKFAERLGEETLVPIEELLNLTLQFAQDGGGTLQDFLDWFESDKGEIKREGLAASDDVKIMTVHGAKGLQAPLVILADITSDPEQRGRKGTALALPLDSGAALPMLSINKKNRFGKLEELADELEAKERAEHNRLLYVALTRAEERLVLTGSLGKKAKAAPEQSWYVQIEAAMQHLGCDWEDAGEWDTVMRFTGAEGTVGLPDKKAQKAAGVIADIATPDWLFAFAAEESRPPRPLAPSRIDDDDYGDAPARERMAAAAHRGKLIHSLFERFDATRVENFADDAAAWLKLRDREVRTDHAQIIAQIEQIVSAPAWQPLFSTAARAEVPLAALVGESVITGRIDRMLIGPDRIQFVDFKTGRSVPGDATSVPVPLLRQMAHYVAALEVIFPGRQIEAALLFTHEAQMIALPAELLAAYKPG